MAKSHICFDIGSEYLKMVEIVAESSGVQLRNFAVAPLTLNPDMTIEERNNAMAQTMRSMLVEKGIKTKTVSISISGQSVFTRFVQLPPVDETKVAQIIKFEAQQQVPFPIEEVEWDYHIVGSTKAEEINVVLVAIKKEIVMGMVTALKKAGYDVETISAAPLSIYNAVAYNEDLYSGAVGVVDLGAKTTTLLVCDGDVLWSRNIPIGSENITQAISKEMNIDITEAEKIKKASFVEYEGGGAPSGADDRTRQAAKIIGSVCSRLISEIRRSIGFYRTQSKGGGNIQRILLSGGGMSLSHLREYMEGALKVPVEKMFPIKKLSVAATADRNELNNQMHLLCDSVGLGIRMAGKSRVSINLLPKIIAYQKELSRKKVFIAGAAICLIATVLAFAMKANRERNEVFVPKIKELDEQISRLTPIKTNIQTLKAEIGKLDAKIRGINKIQSARLYWPEFIDTLKKKKPRSAWFTEIKVGGIERSTISFGGMPMYGTGAYNPYAAGGSMLGGSMLGGSGMAQPGVKGGMINPYSRDAAVEGEKGFIELTGYLRIKRISGTSQDIAIQVEELRQILESKKQKFELELAWKTFNDIQMPPKPTRNILLKVIYGQIETRKKQLEEQIKSYAKGEEIRTDFMTQGALERLFEKALEEIGDNEISKKELQNLKEYSDKFERILEMFNSTARSDFFGTIETINYSKLDFMVGEVAKFIFKAKLNRAIQF